MMDAADGKFNKDLATAMRWPCPNAVLIAMSASDDIESSVVANGDLFMKKPISISQIETLWQLLLRDNYSVSASSVGSPSF